MLVNWFDPRRLKKEKKINKRLEKVLPGRHTINSCETRLLSRSLERLLARSDTGRRSRALLS